ncbi:MAG TPA: ribonuclease H-like domain-containing protein [Chitinophagaceae bacterium]|nr:ribonuclease H-like domain-containing protein [Chitinophagaceae bacterium]
MSTYPFNSILFLDIETVPQYAGYDLLPKEWKALWGVKASYIIRNKEDESAESVYPRAGIYAEFGKIICVGCGIISGNSTDRKLSLKCFSGDDEKLLLYEFSEMLNKWSADGTKYLCAHNGKEFDFPYLCRRLVVNHLPIPPVLQLSGKKPWEVNHLDTLELWKFGDFKSYTSLNLLAHALNITTPKDDIDGSKVWEVYWKEKNIDRIITYCRKDVITVAQIFLRLNGEPLIKENNIEIKS